MIWWCVCWNLSAWFVCVIYLDWCVELHPHVSVASKPLACRERGSPFGSVWPICYDSWLNVRMWWKCVVLWLWNEKFFASKHNPRLERVVDIEGRVICMLGLSIGDWAQSIPCEGKEDFQAKPCQSTGLRDHFDRTCVFGIHGPRSSFPFPFMLCCDQCGLS